MGHNPGMAWQPRYTLTPAIVRHLLEIEAARAVVEQVTLPPAVESELRRRARIRATHYSTRIEGNRLTLAEAEQVVTDRRVRLHGRERDAGEVRNYWRALLRVEEWAARNMDLTEDLIRRLHALVEDGRTRPTPYRDGQSMVRDSETGALVYLPPEAGDVPSLMAELVAWVRQAGADRLSPPIVAAMLHYQFVTIHPFYDGNGRTARLLTNFVLQRNGYGLKGVFSIEEEHARDQGAYYQALAVHPHHNYYEGRSTTDSTPWLEYFLSRLSRLTSTVGRSLAETLEEQGVTEEDILADFAEFRRSRR